MKIKQRIAFIGPNHLHISLIQNALMDFDVVLYPDWDIRGRVSESVTIVFLDFIFVRSTHFINKLLGLELSPPKYFSGLIASLRTIKPDIIVVMDYYNLYFWQTIIYSLFSARRVKIYLYSETKMLPRGMLPRCILFIFTILLGLFKRYISGIFVYSQMGCNFFYKYGFPEKMISILPIPIDTQFFSPQKEKSFISDGILKILMVARFVAYKNHTLLLAALSEIYKEKSFPFHLTLIGNGGYLVDSLKDTVDSLGLHPCVTFLDRISVDEMPNIYVNHDILVLPSFNEAVGMVVPEAAASGIPVIISPTVGAQQYVVDKKTGFILPSMKVSDMKHILFQCYDPNTLSSFGVHARIKMEKEFSSVKIYKDFLDFISLTEAHTISK